jgi:hypothetical protein
MMQNFTYAHLPPHLQKVSKPFCELAEMLTSSPGSIDPLGCSVTLPENRERLKMLDKLLEAKDCAVRSLLAKPVTP